MSLRVIQAPGVQINEIDKSQYSPSMVGTACYVMGFANKGEAYIPMEFTSRAAWTNYYGEPDNEAERYFYNACIEVLNQNGRLYCARLPYSNDSFEKIVGFKYKVDQTPDYLTSIAQKFTVKKSYLSGAMQEYDYSMFDAIVSADSTVDKASLITPTDQPYLFDLSTVDEYRTDEAKVEDGTFVIIDKTCATYKKIQEDHRKGQERELLGIVPVVTTAANAMYAQKLIEVEPRLARYYEPIGDIKTLFDATSGIVGNAMAPNQDLVTQLNSTFKNYDLYLNGDYSQINTLKDIDNGIQQLVKNNIKQSDPYGDFDEQTIQDATCQPSAWIRTINDSIDILISEWEQKPLFKSKLDTERATMESLAVDADHSTLKDIANSVSKLLYYYNCTVGWHAADGDDNLPDTVSQNANGYFPSISYGTIPIEGLTQEEIDAGAETMRGAFDRANLKKIGVIIYKAYIDPSEGNKISFEAVEAFAGSLFKEDKNINTGVTEFIDTIINTQSNYIYFFSNCFNRKHNKLLYKNDIDLFVVEPVATLGSLGFYEYQVEETIDLSQSIYDGMNKCFDKVQDINERNIDIIPDAGIANIGSFLKAVFGGKGKYDLNAPLSEDEPEKTACALWKADKLTDAVKTWKSIEQKFDVFCKSVRKDCMFIADGLRPLVIAGQKKIIRESKPSNTIDANILPYIKNLMGLNTSYGAGYLDWFQIADEFTGDLFWCPPSIKAMGSYIYTDLNFNYWDAPAGLTRGIIAAVDVAFSPTPKQAGAIYEKNWNYAINYPNDGIILEGQKTFQVKPTAFDRVNVRRLFLRLERAAYQVARYFVYEGNTAYTRQRLVDALDPYFKAAKVGGGVYDYKIRCDESINTPTVIDNNELRVQIGIKPVKTAEFILIDFIALSTGGSFEEAMG